MALKDHFLTRFLAFKGFSISLDRNTSKLHKLLLLSEEGKSTDKVPASYEGIPHRRTRFVITDGKRERIPEKSLDIPPAWSIIQDHSSFLFTAHSSLLTSHQISDIRLPSFKPWNS